MIPHSWVLRNLKRVILNLYCFARKLEKNHRSRKKIRIIFNFKNSTDFNDLFFRWKIRLIKIPLLVDFSKLCYLVVLNCKRRCASFNCLLGQARCRFFLIFFLGWTVFDVLLGVEYDEKKIFAKILWKQQYLCFLHIFGS